MRATCAAAMIALVAVPVQAATFQASTASATSEFSGSYVAENTINGSGITGAVSPEKVHFTYKGGNHWTTAASTNPLDQAITWGFAAPVTVGGLWIWNHLSNNIASNSGYEPTLFSLTFLDAGNSVISAFANITLAPQPAPDGLGRSQAFTLAAPISGVAGIRFDVDGKEAPLTGSQAYTGLAEVLFSDQTIAGARSVATVPLPPAIAGLIAALGGLGLIRRRKG